MKIKTPKSHQTDKNNNKKNHHLNKHCSLIGKMKTKKKLQNFLRGRILSEHIGGLFCFANL